ncbi:unnamed protein product [Closterium sp. NIES-53]
MPKPETRSLFLTAVGENEKSKQRIIGVRLDNSRVSQRFRTRILSKHNPETGEADFPGESRFVEPTSSQSELAKSPPPPTSNSSSPEPSTDGPTLTPDPSSPTGLESGTVLGSVLDLDPSQRRTVQVTFTCGVCGARTSRLANPLALKKGTVFVQCGGCEKFHRLVDNLGLIGTVMDFELRRAQQRYEKEQREKREAARVKAERQRKAKEEIEARRRAIEEAQRLKRLEEVAAAEAARRQAEADLQAGGGIRFNRELIPVAITGDRDKITLPQSVLSDLPLDEALDRGPMLFELSVPRAVGASAAGASATGGMEADGEEEDDADEGGYAVDVDLNGGLPPLILRNLGLSGIIDVFNPSGTPPPVRVRFVKLPKATFARLQPLRHGFLADVANHRAVLEAALRGQAALTRGDLLLVGSEVGEVAVRVCEVKGVGGARGAATVIDADVEIELSPWEGDVGAEGKGRIFNRQGEGKGKRQGEGKGKEGEMGDAGRDGKNEGDGGWAKAGIGRKLRETDEQQGETREKGEETGGGGGGVGAGVVKREVIHVGSADRHLLVLPIGGKGLAGKIQEGEWRYFKVYVDGRFGRRLYQGEVELEFRLQLEGGSAELAADVARGGADVAEGDADLYLSRHPIVYPSFLDHEVSSILPIGSKTLVLSASALAKAAVPAATASVAAAAEAAGVEASGTLVSGGAAAAAAAEAAAAAAAVEGLKESATYTIAVHGVAGTCRFNISALSKELISSDIDPSASAAAAAAAADAAGVGGGGSSGGDAAAAVTPPADQSRCANCRQLIATRTLPLHEAYCSRHNVVCPHPGCSVVLRRADLEAGGEHHQHCGECGEVFGGRKEREKHERVRHGEMVCECGLVGKATDAHHHRRTTCPHRPILCRFCAALVPALGPPLSARDSLNGLSPHDAHCGVLSHINLSLSHPWPLLMFRLCLPSHFPHLLFSPTLPHQHHHQRTTCPRRPILCCLCAALHHHRRTTCPHRPILCRFCAALVPALGPPLSARDHLNGLSPHEAHCGARTAPCDTCRRPVMLKEMDVHVAAFHSLPATSAASPAAATANNTTTAAAAAAAAAFSVNAPVAVGGGRGTHTLHTDMDEEHWARAYAGDFEAEQGLEGRGGFGMVGDVGNVAMMGGNLEGGLESGISGAVSGRSLNVGCPICGVMVHSERDMNVHLDAAH